MYLTDIPLPFNMWSRKYKPEENLLENKRGLFSVEKIQEEGIIFDDPIFCAADRILQLIITHYVNSQDLISLELTEENTGAGIRVRTDALHLLKMFEILCKSENHAVTANGEDLNLNFYSHFWNLRPSDVIALGKTYSFAEIAKREDWLIHIAIAAEECTGDSPEEAAVRSLAQEFEGKLPAGSVVLARAVYLFMTKKGIYDSVSEKSVITRRCIKDFFIRCGYAEGDIDIAISSLVRGFSVQEAGNGNLEIAYSCLANKYLDCRNCKN